MSRHSTNVATAMFQSANPGSARREPERATATRMGQRPAARPVSTPSSCQLQLTDVERSYLRDALPDLTRREREVILELCEGGTNEAMADRLCIALPTLRTHLMRLNQKLGATSKGDLIRLVAGVLVGAYRQGRLTPPPVSPA